MAPSQATHPAPVVALLLALLAGPVAGQGVVFEMTNTDRTTEPATSATAEVRVLGGNASMEVESGGEAARVIFRGDSREMVFVSDARRSYMVLDEAALQSMAGRMNAAMSQMERMLESLPEEQRAMVREQMGAGMPGMGGGDAAVVEARRTGRTGTHAGYETEEWEITEDGVVVRRLHVAPWADVPGGAEVRDVMVEMMGFMDSFLESMARMPSGPQGPPRSPFADFDLANGLPVTSQELDESGAVVRESVLTSAERGGVDPASFDPPSGYTRMQLPGG